MSPSEMEILLRRRGANKIQIIDATCLDSSGTKDIRGQQIEEWLNREKPWPHFLILDDSDDMGSLGEHLVRTTWQKGLERHHVEELVMRACFHDLRPWTSSILPLYSMGTTIRECPCGAWSLNQPGAPRAWRPPAELVEQLNAQASARSRTYPIPTDIRFTERKK